MVVVFHRTSEEDNKLIRLVHKSSLQPPSFRFENYIKIHHVYVHAARLRTCQKSDKIELGKTISLFFCVKRNKITQPVECVTKSITTVSLIKIGLHRSGLSKPSRGKKFYCFKLGWCWFFDVNRF